METIVIALIFLWLGFVGAISFMESWMKFRVKELTLPIGLSIGRKVFSALNKVEIVISIALITIFVTNNSTYNFVSFVLIGVGITIVLIQTFWLLPMLDKRVEILLAGKKPEKSMLHMLYVSGEMIKVACLIAFALLII